MTGNPLRSIGRASAVAIAARAITMLLGLSAMALLSRLLHVEALAAYWIAVSALGLVVLVAQTGIGQVSISQVSQAIAQRDHERARVIGSNALAVATLAGAASGLVAAALLGLGISGDGRPSPAASLWLIVAGGIVCPMAMQAVDTLRSQQRLSLSSWLAAQPASGGVVPSTVLLVGLGVVGAGTTLQVSPLTWASAMFVAGWLAMLLIAGQRLRRPRELAPALAALSPPRMRALLVASAPVVGGGVAMFVITQADLWFVYRQLGAAETASYGIAASFVKYVSAANVMLGALLPGLVGQLWASRDQARLAGLLVRLARIGAAVAGGITLLLLVIGKPLLAWLVGPDYVTAWAPLLALSAGHLMNALLGYSQVLLVTAGATRPILIAGIAACVTTLVGLALATPRWGTIGAALASSAGVVVYNAITCAACVRLTGIHCHALARPFRSSLSRSAAENEQNP